MVIGHARVVAITRYVVGVVACVVVAPCYYVYVYGSYQFVFISTHTRVVHSHIILNTIRTR